MTEPDRDRQGALLTALTTEHVVLQTAANATYTDSAARSSLYVFSLSSSVVAMGFMSQSPEAFPIFVAIVLPAVFLLGVLTVLRLVDSSLENQHYLVGIARIRGLYRSLLPDAERYFAAWTGRWPEGPEPSLGLGTVVAYLGTTATMIAFINSVVAGVGVALLIDALVGSVTATAQLIAGLSVVGILMVAFYAFQHWRYEMGPPAKARLGEDEG